MSSIQNVPVEVLLDVFQSTDPADTEALQLTCRRFNAAILQNVDTLPMRLVCDLAYGGNCVGLYRAIYRSSDKTSTVLSGRSIADAKESPKQLQDMYQLFGRKTAIRTVHLWIDVEDLPDARLMHLIEHFPSVKRAVRLDIDYCYSVLPTDVALHPFERLETVRMATLSHREMSSFWSDLFASKAFRHVPNIIILDCMCKEQAKVDKDALFDFITDVSLMPAGKPRVVLLDCFSGDFIDALARRFDKFRQTYPYLPKLKWSCISDIASIRGHVCAIISDHGRNDQYLTNMASGSQKETLADQLLLDAYGVPAVKRT
ncbi:hypothetical protein AAVH_14431 [Aphelenchoides avenae]|nr:hypothetical protein AAVH_14431 [Aphelenchus avenae]